MLHLFFTIILASSDEFDSPFDNIAILESPRQKMNVSDRPATTSTPLKKNKELDAISQTIFKDHEKPKHTTKIVTNEPSDLSGNLFLPSQPQQTSMLGTGGVKLDPKLRPFTVIFLHFLF